MYESDKAVGLQYWEAVRFFDAFDLWDEVFGVATDCYGNVTKVFH